MKEVEYPHKEEDLGCRVVCHDCGFEIDGRMEYGEAEAIAQEHRERKGCDLTVVIEIKKYAVIHYGY